MTESPFEKLVNTHLENLVKFPSEKSEKPRTETSSVIQKDTPKNKISSKSKKYLIETNKDKKYIIETESKVKPSTRNISSQMLEIEKKYLASKKHHTSTEDVSNHNDTGGQWTFCHNSVSFNTCS